MPKLLAVKDPNLVKAVERNARSLSLWGWLFIGVGLVTEISAGQLHPVAGFPFIGVGVACLVWREPALFAAVAALALLSIPASLNARISLLGPDPLAQLADLDAIERIAVAIGKVLVALTAGNQFFIFRLLYGTARATTSDPDLDVIPEMVPNRTNRIARWGRTVGLAGFAAAALAWLLALIDPGAFFTRVAAEFGGSLAAVAVGLGLGAAFSPTDEREAALLGTGAGMAAFLGAALLLVRM